MKKTHKIVMLSTEDINGLVKVNGTLRVEKGMFNYPKKLYPDAQQQHLYILSNDEIKEGDWYYDIDTECFEKAIGYDVLSANECEDCYKIIASTDPKLDLPQIPQSLIEYYADHHPEEIELKSIDVRVDPDEPNDMAIFSEELKLQDNKVVWVEPYVQPNAKIEKLYTREEVEKLTHAAYLAGALANARGKDMFEYWKWHKTNL